MFPEMIRVCCIMHGKCQLSQKCLISVLELMPLVLIFVLDGEVLVLVLVLVLEP